MMGQAQARKGRCSLRHEAPEIVLDLSRLLSRILHSTPTGVDRVEMAYAQTLAAMPGQSVRFAAVHPAGWSGRLPTQRVLEFLEITARRWEQDGGDEPARTRWAHAARAIWRLAPRPAASGGHKPAVYLHLSARALERTDVFRAALKRENAAFVPFVHDLIPLQHPEYVRPNGPTLYRRKIDTVVALADGVIVNSAATAEALAPLLGQAGRRVPVHVAPLAPAFQPFDTPPPASTRPYFVVLGTIEPRKNHLLLLNVWRQMVQTRGLDATPRLVIAGRRGWENENILDMLDRCDLLRPVVEERGRLSDRELRSLLGGARAVLMPSFAEGFGLPIVEALTLGTPVIASHLPALQEAGGRAPEYLDPLDGPAWARAIIDYATPGSLARQAQLERLRRWRAPTWDDHVLGVLDFLREVSR